MPKLENVFVKKVVNHFMEDMKGEGLITRDLGVDDWNLNGVRVGYKEDDSFDPYALVNFRFDSYLENQIPEHLENYRGFKSIRNLLRGSRLLFELQRWAEEHGKFLKRGDSTGVYIGPHDPRIERRKPDWGITRIYSIHPEVYDNKDNPQ